MATKTTKYFKFTKVDADSGFSVISYPSQNQVFPELPGLKVFYGEGNWFYATADSTAKENPLNNIFCLTAEDIYADIEGKIISEKNKALLRLSGSYTEIAKIIDEKYDEESSSIGAIRYADAKEYVASGTSSALLDAEVSVSGEELSDLAPRIIAQYDEYLATHAKLSGLKNGLNARISSFTVDSTNFVESLFEWLDKKEELGNADENLNIPGGYSKDPLDITYDIEKNYTIRYYSPNLHARWGAL